jgi:hypothetical protein
VTFAPMVWPVVVAVVLLWGLGALLSWCVGLRGLWAVAAAPPFALTVIGGTAVVASWLGVPWSPLPVVVMTAVVGAVILLVRRRWRPTPSPRRRVDWVVPAALALAAVVLAVRLLQIVQAPENVSQSFDNIFHLNAVRWVLTEADGSSLRVGYMTSPDGSLPFYPAGWHDLVSLVVQLSGSSIPVAINAVVFVTAVLVWPISAVALVRVLFGRSRAVTVAAALISTALPAFPILPMDYGVLYPFQLSLALLPVALAATAAALRVAPWSRHRATGWWVLVLIGVIPGLALAHPGGFVAWLALSVPMVLVAVVRALRAATSVGRRVLVVALTVGYLAIGLALVVVLRPPLEARGWPAQMSTPDAVWQVASLSVWYLAPAVVAAVCVLVGLAWVVVDRTPRALVAAGMYLIGVVLFVTVASIDYWPVRDLLTGSWYNNLPRLASILAVALVPVAAYGAGRTWSAVSHLTRRARGAGRPAAVVRAGAGVAAAAVLLAGLQFDGAMGRAVEWASPLYRLDADSPLLNTDEYTLLERVAADVPPGVVIAGSPWTGASLAFAISDRPVLMPHTLMYISDEMEEINDGLDEARPGGAVCRALDDLGVGYVLDFGAQEVHPGEHPLPGLADLADSAAVELVDQQGAAKLYRVVACG